ncbi:hypothetical protein TYRP_007049 [Tyrophagus putrescentiae]|nr:hypothetical protein TYRP_007049 [Tyrophagus putrescentiae]
MSSMEAPPPPPSPPPATKSSAAYPSSSSLLLYSSKLLPPSSPSPSPSSVSSFASRSTPTKFPAGLLRLLLHPSRRLFVLTGLLLLLLFLQHYLLLLPQARPASTFLHQNVSQPQGTTGVSPEHARSSHHGDQHQNHRPLSSSHSQSSSSSSSSSSQSSFDRRSKESVKEALHADGPAKHLALQVANVHIVLHVHGLGVVAQVLLPGVHARYLVPIAEHPVPLGHHLVHHLVLVHVGRLGAVDELVDLSAQQAEEAAAAAV